MNRISLTVVVLLAIIGVLMMLLMDGKVASNSILEMATILGLAAALGALTSAFGTRKDSVSDGYFLLALGISAALGVAALARIEGDFFTRTLFFVAEVVVWIIAVRSSMRVFLLW